MVAPTKVKGGSSSRILLTAESLPTTTSIEKFNGGPVGVETLASSIGEEVTTLLDVCEPFLLQNGFIKRTPRGRVATGKSYQHLGINYQENLFM